MAQVFYRVAVALLAICAGLGTGCKAKPDTETAETLASKAPGSGDVMAALEKKDYEGAIAKLIAAQQLVATKEQQDQLTSLTEEVKIRLLQAAPDDPKAAEALSSLRAITGGR